MVSALVAVVAAWLARSTGMIVQGAIMCAGGAFVASMTLLMVIFSDTGLLTIH